MLIVALALAASLDSLRAPLPADSAAVLAPGAATAAATPADTSRRVPGTRLRFGFSDHRLAGLGFHLDRAGRVGSCTWFGLPATARFELTRDRLDRAHFELKDLSARDLDYVQDQLAREGYRRSCTDDTPPQTTCTWTGRDARVTATLSADAIAADVVAIVTPPAAAAAAPVARAVTAPRVAPRAAAPPPASPAPRMAAGADTAVVELAALERAGAVLARGEARTPKAARDAGVMGRVVVIAHVDSSGAVRAAEVVRSVALLDRAALEAARGWRFGPAAYGRRVRIPVVFTY